MGFTKPVTFVPFETHVNLAEKKNRMTFFFPAALLLIVSHFDFLNLIALEKVPLVIYSFSSFTDNHRKNLCFCQCTFMFDAFEIIHDTVRLTT